MTEIINDNMERKREITVIGGGPGGYVAAIRAAQLGAQVTLIEKEHIGGTCLNVGCIPTKCLLHSAGLIDQIRNESAQLGLRNAETEIDFTKIMKNKDSICTRLAGGVDSLLHVNGVHVINGTAEFFGKKMLKITDFSGNVMELRPDAVIIATGSVNAVPPIPGALENPNCIDSTIALSMTEVPESMAIIGGGVIGMEMASAYSSFGTEVTVIEVKDQMLPMVDYDLTKIVVRRMKKKGIKFHTNCRVHSIENTATGVKVVCSDKKGEEVVFGAEKILIATGRKPNTASLNLETCGIETQNGFIKVNDRMMTEIKDVYAIGDCVYGYTQLAHTASAMGEVAAENIMGIDARYDEKTKSTCVYTTPEIATVGLTEAACAEKKIECKIGRFPMSANGKALITNGGEGLVKVVADAGTNEILGVHIVGPRATDMISEGALAIKLKAKVGDVINTIHPHPTVSEAVREAALNVENRAIHIF